MADPMHQFEVKPVVEIAPVNVPGLGLVDLSITNSTVAMFVAATIIILFFSILLNILFFSFLFIIIRRNLFIAFIVTFAFVFYWVNDIHNFFYGFFSCFDIVKFLTTNSFDKSV